MSNRIIAATASLLLLSSQAHAHVHLQSATPTEGATLSAPPESIMLMFSAPARLTALTIQKEGEAQQKLGPLPQEAAAHLMVPAPKLAPGRYTVDWRVVSGDNHIMSGKLHFTVGAAK